MKEKKKYLEGTGKILRESMKEKVKYKVVILGKEFVVYPNVFSPKYFKDTEFFAKCLPIKKGDEFLEIGCGTGIISVFASAKGASTITAIDINPAAIKNTKENIRLHNIKNNFKVLKGDIFKPLKDHKFTVIFWNTPFGFTTKNNLTVLEKAVFDENYKSTRDFIKQAWKYLKKNGRLVIGFSSTLGHLTELRKILIENGYTIKILKQTLSKEAYNVKFELIEARLK
ncbi:methyltransferase [Candidatus Woesearchaeota archaeon]|nr:methyltransferase [Candidatus Woesearchaeota archaeon]